MKSVRVVLLVLAASASLDGGTKRMTPSERIDLVLRETQPLRYPRGDRLPLYVWAVMDLPGEEAELVRALKALDERGIAACSSWRPGRDQEKSLARALQVAAIQKRLGLRVNVNAISCTYSLFDGSAATAHVDANGKPFFDTSSDPNHKLGCPFAVRQRYPAMKEQAEYFARGYKAKGIPVDFVFADWEIDGPIEWNDGWEAAKRCTRCREHIRKLDDFLAFQKAYRTIRSEFQRECYAKAILKHFPKALVGNYSVYPHNGWRYWYDYYEKEPGQGMPVQRDQRAPYRPWFHEFGPCGYTFAMPVVYTWYRTWGWYDWESADYRWFYNLLLVASNPAEHTPAKVPIITFVHYTTTSPPKDADPQVKQFSEAAYQELLWHMLLRRHDTFFLWSPEDELAQELRPLHRVWAAALEYREFLDKGTPVTFEVPKKPGPVLSGLRLGRRVLIRRSDFDATAEPVPLKVGRETLQVPRAEGKCQVLELAK